jgi:hypothetical protein
MLTLRATLVCALMVSTAGAASPCVDGVGGGRVPTLCFAASPLTPLSHRLGSLAPISSRGASLRRGRQGLTMQKMGRKQGEFDLLSGKDFDLLAFRTFRREAKLRYSNLNQSEPLRIFIFGSLAVIAGAAYFQEIFGALDVKDQVVALTVSIGSFAIFLRERSRRTAQRVCHIRSRCILHRRNDGRHKNV